jgi:rod shape-determining protein MreC
LVTSGLGGGFPAGYPVGTVVEVKRDPAQSLADVVVSPAAALDRSRELMFVWLTPAAPAAATVSAATLPTAAPAAAATAKPVTPAAKPGAANGKPAVTAGKPSTAAAASSAPSVDNAGEAKP